jgi:NAD(P)-dependent dehydrogenase (short-subunit alcohol dehydrogenase family)
VEQLSREDIAACLRVLARAAADPTDHELAPVHSAVDLAYRAVKKQRRGARREQRREHDRSLLATAARFQAEVPPVRALPAVVPTPPTGRLRGLRRCYVCKASYQDIDAEYHMLCAPCAAENMQRRHARADLTDRRAIVTGGRIKIGFHTALKLLRDGAQVLVTTRFPHDAARRYAAVPDAAEWHDRLWIHGVDFLDLPGVLGLVEAVRDRWGSLDMLVNNAAQTLSRPPEYHREVRAAEALPPPAMLAVTRGGPLAALSLVDLAMFPAGARDETGEQLDLRERNSWVLGVDEISPREWLEVHVINGFVPFLLTGQLRQLLAASPHPDRYVIQVSAMEGSFARERKTPRHPHTNMAKAGLNMLTRTVADEYAAQGIYMSSVDTGWVTDERPHPAKQAQRAQGFRPPLDVIDGAARVYDPIVRGVAGEPVYGCFLKDYRVAPW